MKHNDTNRGRGGSHLSLLRTEAFPRIWEFHCQNRDSPGKAGQLVKLEAGNYILHSFFPQFVSDKLSPWKQKLCALKQGMPQERAPGLAGVLFQGLGYSLLMVYL